VRDKFDNVGKASSIDMPVLVLHGSRDEIVPQKQGKAVASALPQSVFVNVAGASHNNLFASVCPNPKPQTPNPKPQTPNPNP